MPVTDVQHLFRLKTRVFVDSPSFSHHTFLQARHQRDLDHRNLRVSTSSRMAAACPSQCMNKRNVVASDCCKPRIVLNHMRTGRRPPVLQQRHGALTPIRTAAASSSSAPSTSDYDQNVPWHFGAQTNERLLHWDESAQAQLMRIWLW